MAKYVIVRDGVIENVVEWDGGPAWSPPEGTQAHAFDGAASIGWQWNNGSPVDPNPPPPYEPPPPPTPEEKLAATGLTVSELKQLLGIP